MMRFVGSLIFYQDFLFVFCSLFWQMQSIDVGGVLQEVGDADWRAHTRTKCNLNILSYLTLPDPLDYLICAKDIMIIVLLLQMLRERRKVEAGSFVLGFRLGDRGWVSHFYYFLFCFCVILIFLS